MSNDVRLNRRPVYLVLAAIVAAIGIFALGNYLGHGRATEDLKTVRELKSEIDVLEGKRQDLQRTLEKSRAGELSEDDRNRLFETLISRELEKLKEEIGQTRPTLTHLEAGLGLENTGTLEAESGDE